MYMTIPINCSTSFRVILAGLFISTWSAYRFDCSSKKFIRSSVKKNLKKSAGGSSSLIQVGRLTFPSNGKLSVEYDGKCPRFHIDVLVFFGFGFAFEVLGSSQRSSELLSSVAEIYTSSSIIFLFPTHSSSESDVLSTSRSNGLSISLTYFKLL